jgi:hypothetical protein
MDEEEDTAFLNVDLDIRSRTPLEPLVEAFGQKVIVLHVGRWGRRYGAHVEMANGGHQQDADRLVRRLVALVKKLPRSSRRLWKEAQSREFNVGIQAGLKPRVFELRFQPATLESVAAIGGRIVITVYAAERQKADAVGTDNRSRRPPCKRVELTRPEHIGTSQSIRDVSRIP